MLEREREEKERKQDRVRGRGEGRERPTIGNNSGDERARIIPEDITGHPDH